MSLIDNITTLKRLNPTIWKNLKPFMDCLNASRFKTRESRCGIPTLVYDKDGETTAIHSTYDPLHEARVFAQKLRESDTSPYNHVFFYGVGLGYHIEEFLKDHPDMFFTLYEPNPHVFCHYLMTGRLDDLPLRRLKSLYVVFTPELEESYTIDFFNRYHDRPFFVTLPAYQRLFSEDYERFSAFFADSINLIKTNRYTMLAFEKRWTINSMINFVSNLYYRNILNHEQGMFKDKPAILVAAGPSLEDEYDNLRRIRQEGTAYLFTVGSAIKGLVANGIEPHAAITMDPGEPTQYTFTEIIERKITSIAHIYGTSVGFETVRTYPGPQLFMSMDKDTVSPFFLKSENGSPLGMVNDAPTVAITALQLLGLLGFNPIILVGQNLGFRNNQNYAKGIEYEAIGGYEKRDHLATASELTHTLTVEDVYGNQMQTNRIYHLFRKHIEMMINRFPDTSVINTTKGGASILGAPFVELDSLMTDRLTSRVVDEQWLDRIKPASYAMKHLLDRKKRMSVSLGHLKRRLEDMDKIIGELQQHVAYRNSRQLEEDFKRLDKTFSSITRNDFYRTFITPLNMLETAVFGNGMAQVRAEILQAERAVHVVENFGRYVQQCKNDIKNITDVLYPYVVANIDLFRKWAENREVTPDEVPPAIDTPDIGNDYMEPEKDIL